MDAFYIFIYIIYTFLNIAILIGAVIDASFNVDERRIYMYVFPAYFVGYYEYKILNYEIKKDKT